MTSALQSQSSRRNGAQSKGPQTTDGRSRSSKNSTRHGLCSTNFELNDPKEQASYNRLKADLQRTWQAVDEAQLREVEQLAIATWRQGIVANVENALWLAISKGEACAEKGGDGLPSLGSINRYRARIERDLKLAKGNLKDLQEQRLRAVQAEMVKAREFANLTMRAELADDLGAQAMHIYQDLCTNEPEVTAEHPHDDALIAVKPTVGATSGSKRPSRRRLEKLARKQKQR